MQEREREIERERETERETDIMQLPILSFCLSQTSVHQHAPVASHHYGRQTRTCGEKQTTEKGVEQGKEEDEEEQDEEEERRRPEEMKTLNTKGDSQLLYLHQIGLC